MTGDRILDGKVALVTGASSGTGADTPCSSLAEADRDYILDANPKAVHVTQEEIARMVVLVCSPAFDNVTGRALVLDGGRTIPRFPRLGLGAGEEP